MQHDQVSLHRTAQRGADQTHNPRDHQTRIDLDKAGALVGQHHAGEGAVCFRILQDQEVVIAGGGHIGAVRRHARDWAKNLGVFRDLFAGRVNTWLVC